MIQDSDNEILEKTKDTLYIPKERESNWSSGWPDTSGIKDLPDMTYTEWLEGFSIRVLDAIIGRQIELTIQSSGMLGPYTNAIKFSDCMINLIVRGINRDPRYGYTEPSSVKFGIILTNMSLRDRESTRNFALNKQRDAFRSVGKKEDEYEFPIEFGKQKILENIFNYIKKHKDELIYQPFTSKDY